MVLRAAHVVRRGATRPSILAHVEQDLLVYYGVCIIVRPARFASVYVPARHHVRCVHTRRWGGFGYLEEVANDKIWSTRGFCHDPTAIVKLVCFHTNACIRRKVSTGPSRRRISLKMNACQHGMSVATDMCTDG